MSLFRPSGRWPGPATCLVALVLAGSAALAQPVPAARHEHRHGQGQPPAVTRSSPAAGTGTGTAAPVPDAAPSAFSTYRPFADAPPTDWRGANDQVGRIGGWRAYAKEARP